MGQEESRAEPPRVGQGGDSGGPGVGRSEQPPRLQSAGAILWPSFLLACAAEFVFFGLFDPVELFGYAGEPPMSRTAAYTLGFFGFWLLAAASSFGTWLLLRPPSEIRGGLEEPPR